MATYTHGASKNMCTHGASKNTCTYEGLSITYSVLNSIKHTEREARLRWKWRRNLSDVARNSRNRRKCKQRIVTCEVASKIRDGIYNLPEVENIEKIKVTPVEQGNLGKHRLWTVNKRFSWATFLTAFWRSFGSTFNLFIADRRTTLFLVLWYPARGWRWVTSILNFSVLQFFGTGGWPRTCARWNRNSYNDVTHRYPWTNNKVARRFLWPRNKH